MTYIIPPISDSEAIESLPKFDKSVSLLCWAYNEQTIIGEFLDRAIILMDMSVQDYEIVLIDDGSTDNTLKIAQEYQRTNPRLKIYPNGRNMGVGISSRRAIQLASKEYLFWQTIDWCYDIGKLREFLEHLKSYDIVQGARRRPVNVQGKLVKPIAAIFQLFGIKHLTRRSDTVSKALVSVINYCLIRALFQVPVSDYQNVTFYPTKWIQSIEFEARSSFVNPEGIIKSYWNGMSIKEVAINFIARTQGEAKGTRINAIIASLWDIFRLWFKWVILNRRKYLSNGRVVRCD